MAPGSKISLNEPGVPFGWFFVTNKDRPTATQRPRREVKLSISM